MKGGQLVHTIESLIYKMWLRPDSPAISSPSLFYGPSFSNINIRLTPVPFRGHWPLTTTKLEYSLYTMAEDLLFRPRWPSEIYTRIKARDIVQIVGLIDVKDALSTLPAPFANNTNAYLRLSPDFRSHTISIGEGCPGFNISGKEASTCTHRGIAASSPISERIWLGLFQSTITRCFSRNQFEFVRSYIPADKTWRATDELNTVEMRVQFYESAEDPAHPMQLRELASGLLAVLEQWARKDDWKPGWGLIKRAGRPEASLQVQHINAKITNTTA